MTVVARNWQPSVGKGEIDLVAWEGERLVFVEVKALSRDEFSAPDRNVDSTKRDALVRAARNYVRRSGVAWDRVRFDLVGVVFGDSPVITHRKDAFAPNRTL